MVVVVIMYNKSTIKHITFKNKKLLKPKNVSYWKEKKIEKCFWGDYFVKMQSNDEVRILAIAIIEPFNTSWVKLPNSNVLPTGSPSISKVFELIQNVEDILTNIGK